MPTRRRRPSNPATVLLAVLLAVAVAYIFAAPLLNSQAASDGPFKVSALSIAEEVRLRAVTTFATVWLYFLGAILGSFINVVVWRMPRGESVVWRPSRCPYCATAIHARDNIPVFGWLALRGRCRACRLPISPRYPIVEAIAGAIIVSLAYFELISGGANLPVREINSPAGFAFVVFDPQWDLILIAFFHATLLLTLLTWSLIRFDRRAAPAKLLVFAFAVGLGGGCGMPFLLPVDALLLGWEWSPDMPAQLASCATAAWGLVVGAAVGGALAWGAAKDELRSQLIIALALCGLYLGWQAALSVGLLFAMTDLLGSGIAGRAWPRSRLFALVGVVLVQLALWRILAPWEWWPGPLASPPSVLAAAALLLGLVGVGRIAD